MTDQRDDGYDGWMNEMKGEDYAEFGLQFLESMKTASGVVVNDWYNARGEHQACVNYDLQSAFEDWLYSYYEKNVLPTRAVLSADEPRQDW